MDAPRPSPGTVSAARAHLTTRYARGVERLLWETEKLPLADLDAVRAVLDASCSGQPEALDVGAALVLLQAARLDLDRLEFEVFQAAQEIRMTHEAIAAVLELPSAEAAEERYEWLGERHALPHAEVKSLSPGARMGTGDAQEAAERAAQRARRAAARAEEAARRRQQVSRASRRRGSSSHGDAERASARADEARMLADEAADRVLLRLLRAAATHERSAAVQEELARTDPRDAAVPLRKAEEHYRAAAAYRRLIYSWGEGGEPPGEVSLPLRREGGDPPG